MSSDPRPRRPVIAVTQADIDRAIPRDSTYCAVAQAIARTLTDTKRIEVDVQTIRFSRSGKRYVYLTPIPVAQYVVDFDGGRTLQPFAFRLHESKLLPVTVKQHPKTPVGRVVDRDTRTARRTAEAVARSAGKTHAQIKAAGRAAARATYKQTRRAHPGPLSTSTPGRVAPPMIKLRTRNYGHRQLRINQGRLNDPLSPLVDAPAPPG